MTKIFNFIYVFSVVHCRSRITFHVESLGLIETAEFNIGFRGLSETAESVPVVSMRPRKFYDTAGILTKTNIGSHSL
jgi:hypothetical protein